ncbi:4Fe-4S dicluster domain-containing protein [Aquirufa novilacunae]|uniref:(Fe-S)-binding protein n=1 Tax=Aquirufa novilacunae TaxID=3139305 RepID=A0ABW8U302_9BACT
MNYLPQLLFIALLGGMAYVIYQRFSLIIQTIRLARPVELHDQPSERFKRMALLAFGQKKMFSKPIVGFFHFLIYIGFVLINIEVLEILLDGILGTHRLFAPFLGSFYMGLLNFFEILAAGVFVACVFFFLRRGVFRIGRLQASNHQELAGFPVKDAYQILLIEVVLMGALWTMNGADAVLQTRGVEHYLPVGSFVISGSLMPLFETFSTGSLVLLERGAWWFHIAGILAFALYVTYSKHLHIFFAFPSAYFSILESSAKMSAMPSVTHEVKLMLGQPVEEQAASAAKFGAKDVMDLTWKNALDAYSCTECGRCTEQCPANQTGRALSPRKIMMDTRDRLEEVGGILKANKGTFVEDGKSLFDRISAEELRACTSCQACVEACPMELSPLSIILEMRRFQIMELSDAPGAWNAMFANVETNQSPWKFNPADRLNWAKE